MFNLRRRNVVPVTMIARESTGHLEHRQYHNDGTLESKRWGHWKALGALTLAILLVLSYILTYVVPWRHGVPDLERPLVAYPYWRALIFNPLRYGLAKYWERRPKAVQAFSLKPKKGEEHWDARPHRGYVINLDADADRMERFWAHHPSQYIDRFPAHEWQLPIASHNYTITQKEKIALQTEWQRRYPFLKDSSQRGKFGDAACSLSHVLLWHRYLINEPAADAEGVPPLDYLFVFEDDVQFVGSFKNDLEVHAPDTADIVFLAPPAFKRVDIPFCNKAFVPVGNATERYMVSKATRVVGGAGAFAYIITRKGAQKLLQKTLPYSHNPIDLAILESRDIHIYLPLPTNTNPWPAVEHIGHLPSTRINKNVIDGRTSISRLRNTAENEKKE